MATRPDTEPFEDLYRRHHGAVYRFLLRDLRNREDAEDATQTTFLQAYNAYKRGGRPDRARPWLIAIAENLRRRRFHSDRRHETLPLDETLFEAPAPDERVEGLRDALETLPFNQRAALVLREVVGLSYGEIARQLSLSVGSVQMLLFRARRALREELSTASRRASLFLPGWLSNVLPSAERLATQLRVGGAAAAAALAAVAVTGAQPTAPPAADEPPRRAASPQARLDPPAAPEATVDVRAAPRAARARERERPRTLTPPTVAAAPEAPTSAPAPAPAPAPAAEEPARPARVLPVVQEVLERAVPPTPALPELPVAPPPGLPEPAAPLPVPLPAPALPLPPLPVGLP